jgi:hypothetical protein
LECVISAISQDSVVTVLLDGRLAVFLPISNRRLHLPTGRIVAYVENDRNSWPPLNRISISYANSMSNELARRGPARLLPRRNYMAFPRELRHAIPDLHAGRALELDSIEGQSCNTLLFGPLVRLKLLVKETGKLSGQFVVRMDLQPDAARELATRLNKWADAAEQLQPPEKP